jgi:hypothetical protein
MPTEGVSEAAIVLGPMVRYVDQCSATIWMEIDRPCEVEVLGSTHPTFTYAGHHYCLVVLESLPSGKVIPYDVRLDGKLAWPLPDDPFSAPCIRTHRHDQSVHIAFGSCRMAAPHEPPFTLAPGKHESACGVDAFRALGLRMASQPVEDWPDVMLFLGDQVYADESSPVTHQRIERRRARGAQHQIGVDLPASIVADFEEYTWLYTEAWTPNVERWLLSVLPTMMIFDDHDMIDDWNISDSWVRETRNEPWWSQHVIGGLVSYWIYQHLGNLSPTELASEGILQAVCELDDATVYLTEWALESESFTPIPGGYRFSVSRRIGGTQIVMIDSRNGRVLEPGRRRMVDVHEWSWVVDQASQPARHVVLASPLPMFSIGGLHGLQQWNEVVADGRHGRRAAALAEKMRRSLDLEHWAAFARSFTDIELLITQLNKRQVPVPPTSITVLAGDIHCSSLTEVYEDGQPTTNVLQAVCSPLRNNLQPTDRRVLRVALSTLGRKIGQRLLRATGGTATRFSWDVADGPHFDNSIGFLLCDEARMVVVESVTPDPDSSRGLEPVMTMG